MKRGDLEVIWLRAPLFFLKRNASGHLEFLDLFAKDAGCQVDLNVARLQI